VSFVEKITD